MQSSLNATTKLALAGGVLAGIGASACCSITIHKALEKVPGVLETKVDYDHKTATVKYDSDKTNPSALVKATTNAGFPSSLHGGEKK
jgi:mercuric transport protein